MLFRSAIRATIEPQGAREAGAQWRVDNGPWQSSGETASNLSAGEHVVRYQEIGGWIAPAPQTVTVAGGATTETTGTYEALPPPEEIIVDNTDAGFAVLLGTWPTSKSVSGYYGANYAYAEAVGDETPTARARWSSAILAAGTYRVYARWTANAARSRSAPYVIKDGGTELATVRVDQTKNGGTFNLLGTFGFGAGGHVVELHNGASYPSAYVVADAVRFEKVGP